MNRMERPVDEDGLPLRGHEREHVPLPEVRARKYPMLDGGITMGTVCEYKEDGWTWVIVTDLPDTTWGEMFDENDERALIRSDVYPGDEYFDRAVETRELRWYE